MVENKNPDIKTAPGAEDPQDKNSEFQADLDLIKEKKRKQLLHTKKRIDEQLSVLGGESDDEDGEFEEVPLFAEDDSKPLTMADLKRIEAAKATQTAIELANAISDPVERELVRYHIQNTIRPSGNPQIDLDNARAIVNQKKNADILAEQLRRGKPKTHTSGSGAPATEIEPERELTKAERNLMRPPFNLTKEEILSGKPKYDEKK